MTVNPPSIPLLVAEKLSFERDDRLLFADLDFKLTSGQILQVSGANGVGKTTLLRILTRSLSPLSGKLFWRGQPLETRVAEYATDMLYLGHQPGIKHALSPMENLLWLSRLQSSRADISITRALLDAGLRGYEDVPCYSLSAGQLRRVALARLHLTAATLWVLDEPFTAIDKEGIASLETVLQRHVNNGGAVILTSHQDIGLPGVQQLRLGH